MSQNKIIGIDSGKSGCIVELDFDENVCRWLKMPWIDFKVCKYDENILDASLIVKSFKLSENVVYLEETFGNVIFGKSNFSFGMNYGQILLLAHHGAKRLETVNPCGWQNAFYKKKKGITAKEQSRELFFKINPMTFTVANYSIKHHEGLVDAFLIALYGAIREKKVKTLKRFNFNFQRIG